MRTIVAVMDRLGFEAANNLMLSREATEAALADLEVVGPVPCRMVFS